MALIEWRSEFATGFAGVDHEHRALIDLLNRVDRDLQGEGGSVGELLGEVHAQIAAHFALEEQVMRETGYGDYAAHKAEHDRLLDDIRDIMDGFEDGAYAGASAALSTLLRDWFLVHFSTRDAHLHRTLGR